jgi:tagatose 1,6-diphosphate aldolase
MEDARSMSMKLTAGKRAGLEAVSDDRGVIAALALDQRGLLKKMLAKEMGAEPSESMLMEFKRLTASVLTRETSSILLDVEYGLAASKNINGKGLLLAYEKSGYSPQFPEKLPTLTEGWSAVRLKEARADAVKVLVYYSPFEDEWVNEQKKAWVERAGAECRAVDMPLFLELLSYEVGGGNESDLAYAKRKPEIVRAAIEEFSKDRYAADVLKVEFPVQMSFTAGTSVFKEEQAYSTSEAMGLLRSTASLTDKPIVYLSAGVTNAAFVESLEMAAASGVEYHGVLCGRATWQEGVSSYVRYGAQAMEDWLGTVGLQNVRNVNEALKSATPWYKAGSMQG